MKKFINSEMMVHVPLCTNKDPKDVLVVSSDAKNLTDEIQKHNAIEYKSVDATLEALRDCADKSVDVVICDMQGDAAILAHIARILKEDGLVSLVHPSLDDKEQNTTMMQILANYFKIIMPYNLGDGSTALLASKEYHPTADIILQRSDMLDGLDYYNCDIHLAAFAMPNYIRKEYLGIIKN